MGGLASGGTGRLRACLRSRGGTVLIPSRHPFPHGHKRITFSSLPSDETSILTRGVQPFLCIDDGTTKKFKGYTTPRFILPWENDHF